MDVKKDITTKKEETSKGSHDKIIGKTKDGRVVFEGPRGGHYYLTEKGTKVYIKKGVKI
jgi:colicin import membrane protein